MTGILRRSHVQSTDTKNAIKRERNRDAQRRYRKRVKERIIDLQTRLCNHNTHAQTQTAAPAESTSTRQVPSQDLSLQQNLDTFILLDADRQPESSNQDFDITSTGHRQHSTISSASQSSLLEPTVVPGHLLIDQGLVFTDNLWPLDEVGDHQAEPVLLAPLLPIITTFYEAKEPARTEPASGGQLAPLDASARAPSQFLNIMQLARLGDFESVDEFCKEYYCHKMLSIPRLANQQRLSRNRGLPKILSSISTSSSRWPMGEKEAMYNEISACTESIIAQEKQDAGEAFQQCLGPHRSSKTTGDLAAESIDMGQLQDVFMSKMPHLWTLLNALAQTSRSHSSDHSNRVLAAGSLLIGDRVNDRRSILTIIRPIQASNN